MNNSSEPYVTQDEAEDTNAAPTENLDPSASLGVVAANVDDVAFFDNLVEFSSLLFLDKSNHAYLDTLKVIMPVWLETAMTGMEKRPLISGFYKMVRLGLIVLTTEKKRYVPKVVKAKDGNESDSGSDDEGGKSQTRNNGQDVDMEDEVDGEDQFAGPLDDEDFREKIRTFVGRVLVRCAQYTDELLLSCLRMICSVPTAIIENNVNDLVALMKVGSSINSFVPVSNPRFTVFLTSHEIRVYLTSVI